MLSSLQKKAIKVNKFIVFEGIDGSGKSTQIKLLEEKFISFNVKYKFFREPGGNLLSEKIRDILLDNRVQISNISETMLFLAARAQLVYEQIKPALNKNNFVKDIFFDLADKGFKF